MLKFEHVDEVFKQAPWEAVTPALALIIVAVSVVSGFVYYVLLRHTYRNALKHAKHADAIPRTFSKSGLVWSAVGIGVMVFVAISVCGMLLMNT